MASTSARCAASILAASIFSASAISSLAIRSSSAFFAAASSFSFCTCAEFDIAFLK